MQAQDAIQFLKTHKLVAIVRGDFSHDTLTMIVDVLAEEGVRLLEITLNTTGALEAIGAARARLGDGVAVGAGTVRRPEQVVQAVETGAQFIVAPNFNADAVRQSQIAGVLHLPGVMTPTEAETAFQFGCPVLKLFPADQLGGAAYLKAIRAPLDDIDFLPTGGVDVGDVPGYLKAGAVAVGIGGSLVQKGISESELRQRARAFVGAVQAGEPAHS